NHRQALEHLRQGMEVCPDDFVSVGQRLLAPETLQPAAAARNNGNAYYALAQICQALQLSQALSFLDTALSVGLTEEPKYPNAPAQQMKAELLEAQGDKEKAASWFFEAGRSYLWREEPDRAARLLERARTLNPGHAPTYWYRME